MSKKSFKTAFDNLIEGNSEFTPKSKESKNINDTTRATFIIRQEYLDKIKAISFFERKAIKDVLDEALEHYVNNYEKINGKVILPKK